jgi:hypothetical protein
MIRTLAEVEQEAIAAAVLSIPDKIEAARLLGIGKTTLYKKLKDLGIATPLRQSEALKEAPTPAAVPEKPPIKFLLIPSTPEEFESAHLRCPGCRALLVEGL